MVEESDELIGWGRYSFDDLFVIERKNIVKNIKSVFLLKRLSRYPSLYELMIEDNSYLIKSQIKFPNIFRTRIVIAGKNLPENLPVIIFAIYIRGRAYS
jgi:hypothetical protein